MGKGLVINLFQGLMIGQSATFDTIEIDAKNLAQRVGHGAGINTRQSPSVNGDQFEQLTSQQTRTDDRHLTGC